MWRSKPVPGPSPTQPTATPPSFTRPTTKTPHRRDNVEAPPLADVFFLRAPYGTVCAPGAPHSMVCRCGLYYCYLCRSTMLR